MRLDEYLSERLSALSRMRIANLIAGGAARVNGEEASAGRKLFEDDALEFHAVDQTPNAMTPEPLPLEVVHEDDDLIVVVKPAGMLVHPTRGVKRGTLANGLAYHLNRERIAAAAGDAKNDRPFDGYAARAFLRPGIVHRLDRATSGLMVVAKTQRALSRLSQHFHRRLVEKRYLAVVHGDPGSDEMVIRAPIGRDEEARPRWRVMEDGRHAETRLRVLERRAGALTLLELEPVTGRTNQLRIHCAHIGHPIAGDAWYGTDELARLCLHASRLAFHHPTTNQALEFISPMPPELEEVFAGSVKAFGGRGGEILHPEEKKFP